MFNVEKFLQGSIMDALELTDSQNENNKLLGIMFATTILEYAKGTLGAILPIIGDEDIKKFKEDFLVSKQMEITLGNEKGFLRINEAGEAVVRDNKGDIIVVTKSPLVPVSQNNDGYTTSIEVSTLILGENKEEQGASLKRELFPFLVDNGQAAFIGYGQNTDLYYNANSLKSGKVNVLQSNSTNFFREIAKHMDERSIECDDGHDEGRQYADKTKVITSEDKSLLVATIQRSAEECKAFATRNHSQQL